MTTANIVQLVVKAVLSGILVVTVSELAKKNNLAATIVHSLPLLSLTAFIWIYVGTGDTQLVARHSFGTFWFVLPTLPLFLVLPWLLRRGWHFWPALVSGLVLTVLLYLLTLRLLRAARIEL